VRAGADALTRRIEDGGWRMEDGGWRMEDGGWRMEDGGWRMEDGGWRMEDTLVPTVSVGTRLPTLCVVVLAGAENDRLVGRDSERRDGRSHAERGNEKKNTRR
jgi:hypothetical protein